jgi:hypothetical protein
MAVPSVVVGLSLGGAEELSHHRLPSLSPSVPAQPSSSEVGESLEERESLDDVEYHQLLKDYHEAQADLSSTRLNVEMLRAEVDAARDALHFSMNEVSKA